MAEDGHVRQGVKLDAAAASHDENATANGEGTRTHIFSAEMRDAEKQHDGDRDANGVNDVDDHNAAAAPVSTLPPRPSRGSIMLKLGGLVHGEQCRLRPGSRPPPSSVGENDKNMTPGALTGETIVEEEEGAAPPPSSSAAHDSASARGRAAPPPSAASTNTTSNTRAYHAKGRVRRRSSAVFIKTLGSDIEDRESFKLLKKVSLKSALWDEFDDIDLQQLAQLLSIIKFEKGEPIITKGEDASFCGIILSGSFRVVLNPEAKDQKEWTNIPLLAGGIVGEMAYYEGGSRNADVISTSGGVISIITFKDLERLHEVEPLLQTKLLRLLAKSSISKLRAMIPGITVGPKSHMSRNKVETLYVSRLQKQSKQHARVVEIEVGRRKEAEHQMRNAKNKELSVRMKLEKAEAQVEDLDNQLNRYHDMLQAAETKVNDLKARLAQVSNERDTLQITKSATMRDVDSTKTQLSKLQQQFAQFRIDSAEAKKQEFKDLTNRVVDLERQLENAMKEVDVKSTEHAQMSLELAALQSKHADLNGTVNRFEMERLAETEASKAREKRWRELEQELMNTQETLGFEQVAKKNLSKQVETERVEHDAAMQGVFKDMERQMKRFSEAHAQTFSIKRQYKKMLGTVLIKSYVKIFRLKQKLYDVHAAVSSLASVHVDDSAFAAMKAAAEGSDSGGVLSLDVAKSVTGARHNRGLETFDETAERIDFARRSKIAYLSELRNGRASALTIADSLAQEVARLVQPLESNSHDVLRLRNLAEGFFRRNIELTEEVMTLRERAAAFDDAMKRREEDYAARLDRTRLEIEHLKAVEYRAKRALIRSREGKGGGGLGRTAARRMQETTLLRPPVSMKSRDFGVKKRDAYGRPDIPLKHTKEELHQLAVDEEAERVRCMYSARLRKSTRGKSSSAALRQQRQQERPKTSDASSGSLRRGFNQKHHIAFSPGTGFVLPSENSFSQRHAPDAEDVLPFLPRRRGMHAFHAGVEGVKAEAAAEPDGGGKVATTKLGERGGGGIDDSHLSQQRRNGPLDTGLTRDSFGVYYFGSKRPTSHRRAGGGDPHGDFTTGAVHHEQQHGTGRSPYYGGNGATLTPLRGASSDSRMASILRTSWEVAAPLQLSGVAQ